MASSSNSTIKINTKSRKKDRIAACLQRGIATDGTRKQLLSRWRADILACALKDAKRVALFADRIAQECVEKSRLALKKAFVCERIKTEMFEVHVRDNSAPPFQDFPVVSGAIYIRIWNSIVCIQASLRGFICRKKLRHEKLKEATKQSLCHKIPYLPHVRHIVLQYVFEKEVDAPPQVWPVHWRIYPLRPLHGPHSEATALATFDRI